MSISTPHGGGGTRRPSSTKPGGKPKDAPVEKSGSDGGATDSGSSGSSGKPGSPAKAGSAASGKAGSAGSGKAGSAAKAGSSAKSAAGTRTGAAKGARPAAGRGTSGRPGATKAGGKGGTRKPITPIKVNQERNWGPIILFALVGALALGIVGFGAYQVYQNGKTWEDRAAAISGIVNYRKTNPKMLDYTEHKTGPISYSVLPPVGGTHNPNWQRCLGDVYTAPIANEHAVHSEEHGAVWIAYNPDKVSKADIDTLAKKVKGHDFTLMSPFPNLDKPISLQTWGYQLKVDKASDPRIDQFIKALREVSSREPGATCSSGSYITETGTKPFDLPPAQNQTGGNPAGGMPGGDPAGGGLPGTP
jgi:Protein of unknown function (DUF3105)